MPHFTCITTIRECVYLFQCEAADAAQALRESVAALPYEDGAGPFDDELDWLLSVSDGTASVTMSPVGHCKKTWVWREGAKYQPEYLSYVVQTEIS